MSPRLFLDGAVTLHCGDCLAVLDSLPENSIDSVATDPPYHLTSIVKRFGAEGAAPAQPGTDGLFQRGSAGFMGKSWDGGDIAFRPETWTKVLRVLKPGGHLVAFAASKNFAHMAVAIEAAGFEVRDTILDLVSPDNLAADFMASLSGPQADALLRLLDTTSPLGQLAWIYGTGFPKSLDVSKAIDKAAGAERQVVGVLHRAPAGSPDSTQSGGRSYRMGGEQAVTAPATDAARRWEGRGTALKPAFEPIVLARKPLSEKSVAANVLRWGTGALNIDGCRVGVGEDRSTGGATGKRRSAEDGYSGGWADAEVGSTRPVGGRWPANIVHDGSDEVVSAFPTAPGQQRAVSGSERAKRTVNVYGDFGRSDAGMEPRGDSGSAARFFYSAKASAKDRIGAEHRDGNAHPTVKPVALMRWLVRMITPPGGTVLDLFAGTGTTGQAAHEEGFRAVLIEREAEYQADIAERMRRLAPEDSAPAAAAFATPALSTSSTSPVYEGGIFG